MDEIRRYEVGVLKEIGGNVGPVLCQSGAEQRQRLSCRPTSATVIEYFQGLAKALMSPEGLPDEVSEACTWWIDVGRGRLCTAPAAAQGPDEWCGPHAS